MPTRLAISFLLLTVTVFFLACSKGSGGGTTTDPGSGGGGGTTTPAYYYVKTIGVSGGQVTLDAANKMTKFKFTNGLGNDVQMVSGTNLQLELMNANAEPKITLSVSSIPEAYYPNLRQGGPLSTFDVVDADSAKYLYFRIRGFDFTKTRFHQLNLIMCNDSAGPTRSAGLMQFLKPPGYAPASILTNAFIKDLLTTRLNNLQIYIDGYFVL